MSNTKNKIEASDKNINDLLKDQKFFIDYFQREYRWQEKHMVTLIEDLSNAFLKSYDENHKRSDVANYQGYYLGPVVFSVAEGKNSIIDGQQRITSITLFLIYLNHLQKGNGQEVNIQNLVFSDMYGEKSFNMTDDDRKEVLKGLFENGFYNLKEDEEETVLNIAERYSDIHNAFPEELTQKALPFFIDWFIRNVILVKITAYSDENAYTIFETMNDRGMNLTATEMLKGYVLSRINNSKDRSNINNLWKNHIRTLHDHYDTADLDFFKSWFRAKYAITVRPRKADSENQDYEQIGTRLHDWFKINHEEKFELQHSNDFYTFFKNDLDYYIKAYLLIWDKMTNFDERCPHLFYIRRWGIAGSIQDAMLLAPLNSSDNDEIRFKKLDSVARFIETFTVKRSVNFMKFGSSAIQYTFFNIVKNIRNTTLEDLNNLLLIELEKMDQSFEVVPNFRLHQQNRRFVKHLLSRITAYVDQESGRNTTYQMYFEPKGKKFEIEHLWSDHFEKHRDEFEQENDFIKARNAIGSLILLPNGTNQSFNSDDYVDKLPHYLKENNYAQTLHKDFYLKNPNFKNGGLKDISFKGHPIFLKADVNERNLVVKQLCEKIWSLDYFNNI